MITEYTSQSTLSMRQTAKFWVVCVAVGLAAGQYATPPTKGKKHRTTTTTTENPSALGNEIAGGFPFPDAEPSAGAVSFSSSSATSGGPSLPGSTAVTGGNYWWAGPNSPFKPGSQPQPGGGCSGGGYGGAGGCGPAPPPPPPPPTTGGCGGPAGCTGLGTDLRPSPAEHPNKPVDIENNPFLSSAILGKPISSGPQGCQGGGSGGSCGYPGVGPTPGTYPGAPSSPGQYPTQYPGSKPTEQYPGQPTGTGPNQIPGSGLNPYPGGPGSPNKPSGQYPGQQPGQPTGQHHGQPSGQYPGQPTGQHPGQPSGQHPGQHPGQPSGQHPGQPSGQYPGQHPGQPSGQQPGQYPGQPSGQYPGQPSGQHPNQPTGQYPGQLSGQQPGQPTGQYPTQPTGSQYPGQTQYPGGPGSPGKPVGQYPGQPSGTGPTQYPGSPTGQYPGDSNIIFPGKKQQLGPYGQPTGSGQFPGSPNQFPGSSNGARPNVPLRPQCSAPGHACVPAQMCVGGVITASGMNQIRDTQMKECIPGLDACCKIPTGTPLSGPGPVTPRPVYGGQGTTPQPYTGPLNTTPYPGCAAALKCVPENYCTADGVMSDSPVILTREQQENKVPLSECLNMETGVIGKCCKDPNYEDPWPGGMMMGTAMLKPGDYDDGQYHGEGSGPTVSVGPSYNSISSTPQTPGKDHGPKTSDRPGGFNKPFPPPFPGNTPSGSPYFPGKPQNTGAYQPGQPKPSSTPYQPSPGSYQPGKPTGTPYQPGQPSPTGQYQPGQPIPTGQYQPGQPSPTGHYQPGQPSPTGQYQPGQPSPTGQYQPGQPSPTGQYQPGQPSPTGQYQPGQPSPTGQYQPGEPSPTGQYPPGQPSPTGTYQAGQPTPGVIVPEQPSPSIPTHPGHQEPVEDQGPEPGSSCGIRRAGPPGDVAGFAEFPWQALVTSAGNKTLLCGAAIISENAVITAAHCVNGLRSNDLLVKAGEGKLLGQNPKTVQVRPVAAIARHPGYDKGSLAKDLAILVLSKPLSFDTHVDKICVPSSLGSEYFQQPGQPCLITGWGKNALQGPVQGSDMHKIDVTVLPAKECEAQLKNTNLGKYFILNEGFSCAVPPTPSDLCKVDFGSAVACARPDGHYELAGVNSWDIACPIVDPRPSVFATSDAQWIDVILSTPVPVLQAQEETYQQSLLQGENIEGLDTDDKPGFSQGYGK